MSTTVQSNPTEREWGVEVTVPGNPIPKARECQNEQHARTILQTLPADYRPARLVHRDSATGPWTPKGCVIA